MEEGGSEPGVWVQDFAIEENSRNCRNVSMVTMVAVVAVSQLSQGHIGILYPEIRHPDPPGGGEEAYK